MQSTIYSLPPELLSMITSHLGYGDFINFSGSCRYLWLNRAKREPPTIAEWLKTNHLKLNKGIWEDDKDWMNLCLGCLKLLPLVEFIKNRPRNDPLRDLTLVRGIVLLTLLNDGTVDYLEGTAAGDDVIYTFQGMVYVSGSGMQWRRYDRPYKWNCVCEVCCRKYRKRDSQV